MKSLRRNGVALFYEEADGGEPPIVLVHGWCCDHSFFAPQIEHFARTRHRVVAVDLRGHGQSDKPEQPYTVLVDIDASRRGGSWMNQLHDLIVSQEWVVPVAAHAARSMLQQAGMVIREESFVRSLWYPHYLILAEKPSVSSATPAKPLATMSAAPG
jgi:hypothetical protein